MDDNTITLDKETFKALAVGTRLDILKLLAEKQYTLTDLSELLDMTHSTIKQHLVVLQEAGLLKVEDTDRKWKYYHLTWKGRRVVQPNEVRVMFTFFLGLFLIFAAFLLPAFSMFGSVFSPTSYQVESVVQTAAIPEAYDSGALATRSQPNSYAQSNENSAPNYSLYFFALAFLGAILSSFTLGWYTKKRPVIIGGKNK